MSLDDPHRVSHQLDDATSRRLIDRLESRAKDAVFTRLFDRYAARLPLTAGVRVLEIGCGTGAVARALARREGFAGSVVGVDQSPAFVDVARRLAAEQGMGDAVEFRTGDAHSVAIDDDSADVVIAHTLMSHVTDAPACLREMARLVRPGGTIAIFDGDYASLTYAYPDPVLGRRMDGALAMATYHNPLVMRELVRLLPQAGLTITETLADVVSEIGSASFFKSYAETYAPFVARGGLLPEPEVERWLADQHEAMADGTFFASCNYYTYLARLE